MRNSRGQFMKGHKLTPLGHTRTRGYKHTEEARNKIRVSKLGKKRGKFSDEWIKKMGEAVFKRHQIVDFGFKRGEENPSWCGGMSPNYVGFTRRVKTMVKERDGFKCSLCKRTDNLAVHHIDYDKTHSVPENLVTLCRGCNVKVNFRRGYWKKFFLNLCQN